MKKLKFILLGLAGLSLFACNSGSTNSTSDVQTSTNAGNSGVNAWELSYQANGCRTMTGYNSTCQVQINYGGTGTYNGALPVMTGLNGYSNNTNIQCTEGASSTTYKNNPCTVTITNTGASSSTAQTAVITLNNKILSFTVGGGL